MLILSDPFSRHVSEKHLHTHDFYAPSWQVSDTLLIMQATLERFVPSLQNKRDSGSIMEESTADPKRTKTRTEAPSVGSDKSMGLSAAASKPNPEIVKFLKKLTTRCEREIKKTAHNYKKKPYTTICEGIPSR